MGGSARRVVAVVAAIAIPFAAPAIASTIGLSAAIGSAAANVAVGATLGAVAAKATGGDPLIGAITGGTGSYFQGGGGNIFAGPTPSGAFGGAGGLEVASAADIAAMQGVGTNVAPASATASGAFGGAGGLEVASAADIAAMQGVGQGVSDPYAGTVGINRNVAATDFGAQLSGSTNVPPPSAVTSGASLGVDEMASLGGSGATNIGVSPGTVPGTVPVTATTAATTPAGAPATAPRTFTEAISKVPGAIADKFKDPKVLADLTLRAAGQLAGATLAGDGLSDEEKQLLAAERSDLERLRGENETLFRERLSAAQNLIGESRYFDPEYFGLQRARQAQIAGARSKRAGLRGLRGRQRDVAERQFDIETARTTGSAYDVGAQAATTGRLQTQQAGLSLMPSTFPSVSYAGLRGAYESADKRRRQTAGDVANLFGSLTGRSQAGSIG